MEADTSRVVYSVLFVGLGGLVGAILRYLVTLALASSEPLPWATVTVNVVGCFLIGVLAAFVDALSHEMRLLFITGLCGSFTTYSSIILESVTLVRNGDWIEAAGYSLSTLFGGLLAFAIGMGGVALLRQA